METPPPLPLQATTTGLSDQKVQSLGRSRSVGCLSRSEDRDGRCRGLTQPWQTRRFTGSSQRTVCYLHSSRADNNLVARCLWTRARRRLGCRWGFDRGLVLGRCRVRSSSGSAAQSRAPKVAVARAGEKVLWDECRSPSKEPLSPYAKSKTGSLKDVCCSWKPHFQSCSVWG
jgi:hypothetical protein